MFPFTLLFTSDRKEQISSFYRLAALSPSDRDSSVDCIVCLKIGGYRETGVPSAVEMPGLSVNVDAAAVKIGIRGGEKLVASCEKYNLWWDVADNGKLLLHFMTHAHA